MGSHYWLIDERIELLSLSGSKKCHSVPTTFPTLQVMFWHDLFNPLRFHQSVLVSVRVNSILIGKRASTLVESTGLLIQSSLIVMSQSPVIEEMYPTVFSSVSLVLSCFDVYFQVSTSFVISYIMPLFRRAIKLLSFLN